MARRAHILTVSPAVLVLALLVLAALPGPAAGFPSQALNDKALTAPGSGPIAVGDLNGDGRTDIVAANDAGGQLMVFYQGASGMSTSADLAIQSLAPREVLIADMEGNGSEIVALGVNNTTIYHRVGGVFTAYATIPTPGALAIAVGDLNNDSRPDLAAVLAGKIEIHFQGPNGTWSSSTQNITETGFHAVAIADVNGDGLPDLIVAKPYDMRVYYQQPNHVGIDPTPGHWDFLNPNSGMSVPNPTQVGLAVADVNGDGAPDLVVSETDSAAPTGPVGAVSVFLRGTGSFGANPVTISGGLTAAFAVGDLNDDGRPDIATADYGYNASVYVQGAGSTFGPLPAFRVTTVPFGGALGVGIGRFSGDAYPDLALRVPGRILLYYQENRPPVFLKTIPDLVCNEGASNVSLVDLRDYFSDDHNVLRFGVWYQERPQDVSASVDPDGHHLNFTARPGWYGTARFEVIAFDDTVAPAVHSNTFSVIVNALPAIRSTPPGQVRVGETFAYQVVVDDPYPANDTHTFSLTAAPQGATIDASTGLVRWTPAASDEGGHAITIRVEDAYGGVAEQSFELRVLPPATVPPFGVAIVASLLAVIGTVGIGSLVSENVKYGLLMVFLPLYSKIRREQVLDHFVRGQIYGYILANPGEHYNAIKTALNLTNGSLAHHLKTLEREQFVKSRRFGLYRRFYPMNMRIPDENFFAPNEIQKTVMDIIRTNPGITQKEIAQHLGLTPPTVNYHVSILSEHRAIRVERAGRKTHCYIADEPVGEPLGPVGGPGPGTPRPGAPRP